MSADLTTRYLGFDLANPLVVGACPLTSDLDTLKRLEAAGAAAVVLPSLFEEPIEPAGRGPRVIGPARHAPLGKPGDMTDGGSGPDEYLRYIERVKAGVSIPVIASLNGSSRLGWMQFARLIEAAGADAIELNIYFVPIDIQTTAEEVEQRHLDVLAAVRETVSIQLAVKIGPNFAALPNFADRLSKAGANGLVLFNRFPEPEFDLDTFEIRPHLEFSRQAELRVPLRWIAIVRNQVDVSLAATSGIQDVQDVIKALLAGADATMLAASIIRYGPDHLGRLNTGLQHWLESRNLASVAEIKGKMSLENGENRIGLQRANYLETLSAFAPSFN